MKDLIDIYKLNPTLWNWVIGVMLFFLWGTWGTQSEGSSDDGSGWEWME